jgi:hypothetical protein
MTAPSDPVAALRVDAMPARAVHASAHADGRAAESLVVPRATLESFPNGIMDILVHAAAGEAGRGTALARTGKSTIDDRPLLDEGLDRAQRVANARIGADELAWLSKGFNAFLAAGGALPLERCLALPRNQYALQRACRDYWLRRAWESLDDNLSPWRRSERLAVMIRSFRSRRWPRWRALQEAPKFVGGVENALFHAFRCSQRVPQTAMQLHNIANHRQHS